MYHLSNYGAPLRAVLKYDTDNLKENEWAMKRPYDTMESIEVLFSQVKEAVDFIDNTNESYSPNQVLPMAYILGFNTGQLHPACEKWSNRVATDKTWVNFKSHFAQAHKMMRAPRATANNA